MVTALLRADWGYSSGPCKFRASCLSCNLWMITKFLFFLVGRFLEPWFPETRDALFLEVSAQSVDLVIIILYIIIML